MTETRSVVSNVLNISPESRASIAPFAEIAVNSTFSLTSVLEIGVFRRLNDLTVVNSGVDGVELMLVLLPRHSRESVEGWGPGEMDSDSESVRSSMLVVGDPDRTSCSIWSSRARTSAWNSVWLTACDGEADPLSINEVSVWTGSGGDRDGRSGFGVLGGKLRDKSAHCSSSAERRVSRVRGACSPDKVPLTAEVSKSSVSENRILWQVACYLVCELCFHFIELRYLFGHHP